jgi:hypothetical protein
MHSAIDLALKQLNIPTGSKESRWTEVAVKVACNAGSVRWSREFPNSLTGTNDAPEDED